MYYRLKNRLNSTGSKKHVLLVEDNRSMLSLLTNILSIDFSVQSFSCPNEALYWLEGGNKVDVIISDFDLEQTDGADFVKNLKSNDEAKDVPFVFLSGMEKEYVESRSGDIHYDAYINKPFNPEHLIHQIREISQAS